MSHITPCTILHFTELFQESADHIDNKIQFITIKSIQAKSAIAVKNLIISEIIHLRVVNHGLIEHS
jgi:hypothetical protein